MSDACLLRRLVLAMSPHISQTDSEATYYPSTEMNFYTG
jgi:hypothetical protein